jgi:hypothetical protein
LECQIAKPKACSRHRIKKSKRNEINTPENEKRKNNILVSNNNHCSI